MSEIKLELRERNEAIAMAYTKGYQQGKIDEQEFVEKRCNELGIDYTLIFTCESVV